MDEDKKGNNTQRQVTISASTNCQIQSDPQSILNNSNEALSPRPNFVRRNVRRNANIYNFTNDSRLQHLSEVYEQNLIEQEQNYVENFTSIEDFSSVTSLSHPNPSIRESVCSICHSTFLENHKLSLLTCGHSFHEECIVNWLSRKSNCPICREEVD